jgi:hypothetical protein
MRISSHRKANHSRFVIRAAIVACFAVVSTSHSALYGQDAGVNDKWTDSTGKKTIDATFVKLEGVTLTLRKPDGKEIPIPLSKLDDKSRIRARALAKEMAEAAARSAAASVNSSGDGSASSGESTPEVSFPSSPSAQQFFEVVQKEIEKDNWLVVWDALPPTKQNQIQEVVRLAASKVEQRTMDQIKRFRSNMISALQSKKSFVLNSKALPVPPNDRAMIEKLYDPVVAFVESAVSPEFLETSNLKEKSLRDLLDKYFRATMATNKALEAAMKGLPLPPQLAGAIGVKPSIKVEQANDKEATISFSLPQQPAMKVQFVPMEGKWFPKDAVAGWEQAMAQVQSAIQSADPKKIHQGVGQVMLIANGALGAFSAAETQEDFDAALQQVKGMVPSMPGMGPPGMGPPGMPGMGPPGMPPGNAPAQEGGRPGRPSFTPQ